MNSVKKYYILRWFSVYGLSVSDGSFIKYRLSQCYIHSSNDRCLNHFSGDLMGWILPVFPQWMRKGLFCWPNNYARNHRNHIIEKPYRMETTTEGRKNWVSSKCILCNQWTTLSSYQNFKKEVRGRERLPCTSWDPHTYYLYMLFTVCIHHSEWVNTILVIGHSINIAIGLGL